MKLNELFEAVGTDDIQSLQGLYDPGTDTRSYKLDDTRKPKLTLRQLNKLRKYHEFREKQDSERGDIVSVVYQIPSSNPGM